MLQKKVYCTWGMLPPNVQSLFLSSAKKFLLTMNHLSQEQQSKCLPLLVSQGTTRAATRILPDCYWTATRHQPNQTTDKD